MNKPFESLYYISVPVVDLRREPIESKKIYEKDVLQESQLLYGEHILIKQKKENWLFIEALEQQVCKIPNSFQGYPGWIREDQAKPVLFRKTCNITVSNLWAHIHSKPCFDSSIFLTVSFGTCLIISKNCDEWIEVILQDGRQGFIQIKQTRNIAEGQSDFDVRRHLVNDAQKFVGFPYLWGGRSAYSINSDSLTSVDCSGLVNLLYRVQGILIPRDAQDQFFASTSLDSRDIQIGDLIFIANKKTPDRIYHVMLYIGEDLLLEATAISNNVRIISCQERLGYSLKDQNPLHKSDKNDSVFYYGSFI
jgi:hypothetical protein